MSFTADVAHPERHQVVIGCFGTQVTVEVSGSDAAATAEVIRQQWQRCLLPDGLSSASLSTPTTISVDSDSDDAATLGPKVTHALEAARAGKLLMLRATGLCATNTGRTVALISPDRSERNRLARTIGRRYGYVTNELVSVDPELRVLPYPAPLIVDGAPQLVSPDDLGLLAAHPHPTLTRLVLLRLNLAVAEPTLEELPLFDAIMQLAPQMSSLGVLDRGLHQLADLIRNSGPVLLLTYSNPEDLIPLAEQFPEAGS